MVKLQQYHRLEALQKKIVLDSGERGRGERNSLSKPCCPKRWRRVFLNSPTQTDRTKPAANGITRTVTVASVAVVFVLTPYLGA